MLWFAALGQVAIASDAPDRFVPPDPLYAPTPQRCSAWEPEPEDAPPAASLGSVARPQHESPPGEWASYVLGVGVAGMAASLPVGYTTAAVARNGGGGPIASRLLGLIVGGSTFGGGVGTALIGGIGRIATTGAREQWKLHHEDPAWDADDDRFDGWEDVDYE